MINAYVPPGAAENAVQGIIETYDSRRIPVVSDAQEQAFARTAYEQWLVVGAILLRNVQDGTATGSLAPLLEQPVEESLPADALQRNSGNERVTRALRHYPAFAEMIGLPAVPDEQIGDSLRKPTQLLTAKHIKTALHLHPDRVDENLQQYVASYINRDPARLQSGITRAEQRLIGKRYNMARSLKLIALADKLSQENPVFDEQGRAELSGGTVIGILPGKETEAAELLDVQTWRGRTTIHDRVQRITTTNSNFILKEHKGNRHLITIDSPGMTNHTAEAEAAVSADLESCGVTQDQDVSVSWEKAIGFVHDASGFDFVVFAYENDLIPREAIDIQLKAEITNRQKAYEAEFTAIQAEGQQFTWEQFVTAKSYLMQQHARHLAVKAMLELGYADADNNMRGIPFPDHEFRIHETENGTIALELVGMDYEYFVKLPDYALEKRIKMYNDMIDKNAVDTTSIFVKGINKDAKGAAEAIVAYDASRNKRHLPTKIS